GAHPDEWWGLRPLSDDRPLRDLGEPVTVSPSTVDAVRRCGLRWLLERHGGGDEPSVNQEIGNLVHAAAALGGDPEAIAAHVRKGFEATDVPARRRGPGPARYRPPQPRAVAAAPGRVDRPGLGGDGGPRDGGVHGRLHLPRRRQRQVPHLPGPYLLPRLRQGPDGDRMSVVGRAR